jgi:hypothetical protein
VISLRKRPFADTSKNDKKIALEDNATDITKPRQLP